MPAKLTLSQLSSLLIVSNSYGDSLADSFGKLRQLKHSLMHDL